MVKILFILVSASWKTQTFAVRGFHILHKQTLPHNRMHTPFHEEWHLRNPLHRLPPVYRPHTQPKKQNSRMRGVFTAYVSLSKFSCRASHEKKKHRFFFHVTIQQIHQIPNPGISWANFFILCRCVDAGFHPKQAPALGQWMMRKINSSGRRWWFLRRR